MTQHYVIAGRVEADGQLGGSFAWVGQSASDSQRFIRSTLETHGWTAKSSVVVLADGVDGLANLVQRATENPARAILDWFHISMRLRAIEQMSAKTAAMVAAANPTLAVMIREKLPRVRYQMWNGRWANAISRMRSSYMAAGHGWRRLARLALLTNEPKKLSKHQPKNQLTRVHYSPKGAR